MVRRSLRPAAFSRRGRGRPMRGRYPGPMSAVPDPPRRPADAPDPRRTLAAAGDHQHRAPEAVDQERPRVRGARRRRRARRAATRSSRRSSRSSASASPRAAPTSSTTPPTPRPTASTRRSAPPDRGRRRSTCARRGSSPSCSSSLALAITAPINDGKLTVVVAGYVARHHLVHHLAQARAGDRPRRGRRRASCSAPSRAASPPACRSPTGSSSSPAPARCSWSPASATPSRSSSGPTSHEHRRTLGEYSTAYLGYVRAVVVGRDDHRVLPLGVRERRARPATTPGSSSRSSRSCSRSSATRSSSTRAVAARPKRSCSSDRVLQVLGVVWVVTFALGVRG